MEDPSPLRHQVPGPLEAVSVFEAALKLITLCKLTFDERVAPNRMGLPPNGARKILLEQDLRTKALNEVVRSCF